mgnify:CR=1 FL=1
MNLRLALRLDQERYTHELNLLREKLLEEEAATHEVRNALTLTLTPTLTLTLTLMLTLTFCRSRRLTPDKPSKYCSWR